MAKQALAVQNPIDGLLDEFPSVEDYEVIEGTGRKKKSAWQGIGAMNGAYALYFAIVGQIVRNAYGDVEEDVYRFPNSADAAIDAFFGRAKLDDENSYLAKAEKSGRREYFVDLNTQEVQTEEKELQMQTKETSGRQMSLAELFA